MKIGIISDTHSFMPRGTGLALAGVDLILHAGDIGSPLVIEGLELVAPVRMVGGNGDPLGRWPASVDLTLEGVTIHMSHGHELDARGWWLTPERIAAKYPYDVAIFGHTHKKLVKQVGETLVINPGAVCASQKNPSVVILELPSKTVTVVKMEVQ